MAISNLSLEEREELNELYKKLEELTIRKEELESVTRPLYDELSSLNEEEQNNDPIYDSLSGSKNLDDIKKLHDITKKMIEIAEKKASIKSQLDEYEPEFNRINKEIDDYNKKIVFATDYKKEGVLGEGVTYLNKNGEVVSNIDEINIIVNSKVVPESAKNGVNVNRDNGQIIQSKKSIVDYIKDVYSKNDGFKAKLSEVKENVTKFFRDVKKEYNEYYNEKDKRVNEIIAAYEKEKELKKQVEEEANNIELFSKNDEQEEEKVNSIMYMDNSIIDSNNEVLAKNNPEVMNAIEIENVEKPIEEKEESENLEVNQEYNLFKNIDKYDEELQKMESEKLQDRETKVSSIFNTSQKASTQNNKIANSTQNRIPSMKELFEIGKQKASEAIKTIVDKGADISTTIEANRKLTEYKRKQLEEERQKYMNAKAQLEQNFANNITDIEGMSLKGVA